MTSPLQKHDDEAHDDQYRYLVVDSGPLIRLTGVSTLWKRAKELYTVPAVVEEVRDAKARQHLEQLQSVCGLQLQTPTPKALTQITSFAKQTGDYQSLSSVDLQVLALLYDLECQAACNGTTDYGISHIRTTPKRTLGVGKIQSLATNAKDAKATTCAEEKVPQQEHNDDASVVSSSSSSSFSDGESLPQESAAVSSGSQQSHESDKLPSTFSWAKVVNPTAASQPLKPQDDPSSDSKIADTLVQSSFGSMNLQSLATSGSRTDNDDADDDQLGGQFSDAEDDPEPNSTRLTAVSQNPVSLSEANVQQELESEFPSLAAALTVPYEGEDDDQDGEAVVEEKEVLSPKSTSLNETKEEEERRKQESLKPISNSGKLYNSFRKYGDLMKPKPSKVQGKTKAAVMKETPTPIEGEAKEPSDEEDEDNRKNQSRILGGVSFAGQGMDVEDDGEGWITNTREIQTLKATGALDPLRKAGKNGSKEKKKKKPAGPPMSHRAACTTTDFAMQNVILQMNLELLSVDGIKVQKLKSWVTRCGACYKVYTNTGGEASSSSTMLGGRRLFCEHCGSDMMHRVAASVDGKTGRLRLHLSKRYQHNLRGTKYSLPKPGTANRFQGDLLLREDQLLTGAWNQKVKMKSGGKAKAAAQSMFGSDIAKNVGCHNNSVDINHDIRVGFGRRNPNAAKGRERRGKKKKSSDKACGLRRY